MCTYPVVEIFESIQGEGSWIGKPVTFIRFAYCNLKCSWCDTDFNPKRTLSLAEIVPLINARYDLVLTGGEPLLRDLEPLLLKVKELYPRMKIAIETNGTLSTNGLRHRRLLDWVVCSPKPDTGYFIHGECEIDELKYVVDNDFSPHMLLPKILKLELAGPIWLQPEGSNMQEMWRKAFVIAMDFPCFRVGVQLHKIMEVR